MATTTKRTLNPDTNQFEDAVWQDGEDSRVTEGEPSIDFPNGGRTLLQSAQENCQTEGEQQQPPKKLQRPTAPVQKTEQPAPSQPAQA